MQISCSIGMLVLRLTAYVLPKSVWVEISYFLFIISGAGASLGPSGQHTYTDYYPVTLSRLFSCDSVPADPAPHNILDVFP